AGMAARRGLAFGKMRLWGSLGWAVVAAAGGLIWQQLGFSVMFVVAGILFMFTIFLARGLHEDGPQPAQSRAPLRQVVADPRLRVVLLATFVLALGLGMSSTFVGIYLDGLGGGQWLVGIFSGISAASELPVMRWNERIVRRLGGPQTLLLA